MGTNYYLITENKKCDKCGRSDVKERHIGKSSGGWCFSLHVIPEEGIHDLTDWFREFLAPDTHIRNEYGETLSVCDILKTIMERGTDTGWQGGWNHDGYASEEDFHRQNCSIRGPRGLLRSNLSNRYCVKHGAGTWDCIIGEFS